MSNVRSLTPASNDVAVRRLPAGVLTIVALFALGVCASGATFLALLLPESELRHVWRLNPEAEPALRALGAAGIALMAAVCVACIAADLGLLGRKWWGHRLTVCILLINAAGDVANAVVRGDLRTLVGVPIALALLAYLLRPRIKNIYRREASP